ncbi:MAG: 23S rRNA (adenine(1618)-N(6))-methyltransferase RlmF [Flavobacteriaceae bacterium]|nr:23S rRNA (adenine(1618)-N(6))-methyltransferase RlmF [Flavobacteriaceae bacterium]
MSQKKKIHPKIKARLHNRNKHRERYDFKKLIENCKALAPFVKPNKYGDISIDFSNPEAVKTLNKALLKRHYGIDNWDIPKGYLCPPIPGRADYIHHIADLLCGSNYGKIPTGTTIKCLDIGVGASCIYPIIGVVEYGWSFIGTDIDPISIAASKKIIENNPFLKGHIELRLQPTAKDVFYGIITKNDRIDVSVCNPPFHVSLEAAQAGTLRKLNNLNAKKTDKLTLNFGGQNAELWCDGGEKKFVHNMIRQSKKFADSCFWFSTLISKQSNLKSVYESLKNANAIEVRTIPMGQGNKTSRIVAWTFLTSKQQKEWKQSKWQLGKK